MHAVANFKFRDLHSSMQAQVDQGYLPGISTALFSDGAIVDTFCYGFADMEAGVPLREDHIFRVFSNTKLVTSCAVMMLFEEGLIQWDDPIEAFIPELGARQVLKPGATRIDDVEPAKTSITIRQLMTHTSGLSYGMFDPGTTMYVAYRSAGVTHPDKSLREMILALAPLPLSFHPGEKWEYSVATDVLGRLIEIISGMTFREFLCKRIFEPLGMRDTDFWVPDIKRKRLCALYRGADPRDSTKPGLTRADDNPFTNNYTRKLPRESGGGGLVSTLGDTVRLIQSLLSVDSALLRPDTIALMFRNQLGAGLCVQFPNGPRFENKGFGFGSSVTIATGVGEPDQAIDEVGWGGLAGTMWWINPRIGIAGVLMTQRFSTSGNSYSSEFRRQAYKALGFN